MRKITLATGAIIALCATPALAHHPFSTEFDAKAPIELTGTVKKVNWVAPHVTIQISAKDKDGKMRDWNVEAASPEELQKMGLTKAGVKSGDAITVHAYRAKSAKFTVSARMADIGGKTMSLADPADGGPKS